jgi:hypothetical protein
MDEKNTREGGDGKARQSNSKNTQPVDTDKQIPERTITLPPPTTGNYRAVNLEKARDAKRKRVENVVEPPTKRVKLNDDTTQRIEEASDSDDGDATNDPRPTTTTSTTRHSPNSLTSLLKLLASSTAFVVGSISISVASSAFKQHLLPKLIGEEPTVKNKWYN